MPAAVIFVPYAHSTYDVDTLEKLLAFDKDTFGTMLAEAIALEEADKRPPPGVVLLTQAWFRRFELRSHPLWQRSRPKSGWRSQT